MAKREGPQKRQLGRYPRIPFTNQQVNILEEKFQLNQYLTSEEAVDLSRKLHLTVDKIKIWFQNRRARRRREELNLIKREEAITSRKIEQSIINTQRLSNETEENTVAMNIACFSNSHK